MEKFKFNIDGQSFDTSIEEIGDGTVSVVVNGKSYKVEVENTKPQPKVVAKPAPSKKASAASTAAKVPVSKPASDVPSGGKKVVSPLPGSVIKVMVTEGQAVKKGDVLLTLESMKMENSVQSEWDGTVQKINVVAGQTVMQDDLLIVIQ